MVKCCLPRLWLEFTRIKRFSPDLMAIPEKLEESGLNKTSTLLLKRMLLSKTGSVALSPFSCLNSIAFLEMI